MKRSATIIIGIVVFIFPFLLYIRTMCPVVFPGDSSEFAAVIQLPTLAHPPGYPLYTIVGFLITRILTLPPIIEANMISGIFGALTAVMMYITFLLLTKRIFASAAAALLLAFGNTFWKLSSIAEMYTLATLLMAALWWAAIRLGNPGRKASWGGFLLLGLIFGLGMANHQSIILVVPGIILYLVLSRIKFPAGKAIIAIIIGLLIGLAFYLFLLPISHAASPIDAPRFESAGEFFKYVTRQGYFTRSPEDIGVAYTPDQLVTSGDIAVRILGALWEEWGPIFFFVSIIGIIVLVFRRRALGWGLVLSIGCAVFGLCFLSKGSPLGMPVGDLRAIDWLIVPFYPLFAFGFVGVLDGLFDKLLSSDHVVGEETFIPKEKAPVILNIFYIALPIIIMGFNLDTADMTGHIFADRFVDNVLTNVTTPATMYTVGDEYYMFRYKIDVEGTPHNADGSRSDMMVIDSKNVGMYIEETAEQLTFDESLASKIGMDIVAGRRVYLTFIPEMPVLELLKTGYFHIEKEGLIFEAVPDLDPNAAPGTGLVRFADPGHEAEVWKHYDLEHLQSLQFIKPDPLEVPYIERYFAEAVNYGKFAFEKAEKFYSKNDYYVAADFLDNAYYLAGVLGEKIDGFARELALASWYTQNYEMAFDILNYAAEAGIEFPERDPFRANLYFAQDQEKGIELGEKVYSRDTAEWMNFKLVEAMMLDDVKSDKLDAAREKAEELISRYPALTGNPANPGELDAIRNTLAESPEAGTALWHYVSIAMLQGDMDTVRYVVGLLYDVAPDLLFQRLNDLVASENYKGAATFFEMIVEYNPEDWKASEGLAVCYFSMGETEKAKELAEKVIEHRPDSANLKRILGIEAPSEPTGEPAGEAEVGAAGESEVKGNE